MEGEGNKGDKTLTIRAKVNSLPMSPHPLQGFSPQRFSYSSYANESSQALIVFP